MCGRFGFTKPKTLKSEWFGLHVVPDLKPRYNVAPSQSIAAVRQGAQGRELCFLKWGLLPSWAKDPKDGYKSINARAETLAEKPSFRSAFRKRRCIILVDCWYEWQAQDGVKQPYCIRFPDASVIALAGLWEHWEGGGEIIESAAVITTASNEQMKPVHHRMPVILADQVFDAWLDPANQDTTALCSLLVPYPGELAIFPVSRMLNNPRNDDPRVLDPVA